MFLCASGPATFVTWDRPISLKFNKELIQEQEMNYPDYEIRSLTDACTHQNMSDVLQVAKAFYLLFCA